MSWAVRGPGRQPGHGLSSRPVPAPASYGVCFLCAALWHGPVVRGAGPGPGAAAVPRPFRGSRCRPICAASSGLLARDRNLSWFLVARAFRLDRHHGRGFYHTVYALRACGGARLVGGHVHQRVLAGQIAGNLVFGFLADRAGIDWC